VVDSSLYVRSLNPRIYGPSDIDSTYRTQSSLSTIFSIWNFMIGSAILVLAWDFKEAGVVGGVGVSVVACGISLYTTTLCMEQGGKDLDYSDTLHRYYGKKGWYLALISQLLMLFAPLFVYLQYLAQMLYPLVLALQGWATASHPKLQLTGIHFEHWSIAYASLVVFLLMQLVMFKRQFDFFLKIISFGSLFIIVIVLTFVGIGIYSITNTKFQFSFDQSLGNSIKGDTRYIMMLGSNFSPLAGAYCTGYYMHQSAIPILRNNRH